MMLKLIADDTRLKIINILMATDASAAEIASDLSLTVATILYHFKKLESAGMVKHYYSHGDILYSLNPDFLRVSLESAIKEDTKNIKSDLVRRKQIASRFFKDGRLIQLPAQREKREIVLREIAKRFSYGYRYHESTVDSIIREYHPDYCTIRREMISFGIMARNKERYWLL